VSAESDGADSVGSSAGAELPAEVEPVTAESAGADSVGSSAGAELPAEVEPASAESAESAGAELPGESEPVAEPVAAEPVPAAPEPEIEVEIEEVEIAPRARPEIPGADLVPDLVSDSDEFLDAEARAAAEAEAEAAAAREQEEDPDAVAQPIADAAIDLAAGARYTATGKRKTAVARVILKPGTGTYSINGKPLDVFFPRDTLRRVIRHPLETVGYESRMDVVARMHGGGVAAQAGALRHGISRALLVADPNLRGELKRRGFLTRDPRVKERKKAGLKKARKRPQFSKR
jgi:small subunit ribosomal protein S9